MNKRKLSADSKQFLTAENAELYCEVKIGTFYHLRKRGLGPKGHWIDGEWRYWRNDLNLWIKERERHPLRK